MTNYQHVFKFMQTMEQDTPSSPTIPSVEVRKLRAKLILEEALETITKGLGIDIKFMSSKCESVYSYELLEQLNNNECRIFEDKSVDMVELLDGLIDLDVVGRQGTAIAFGFSEQLMDKASDEISRSNLTKLWTSAETEKLPYDYTRRWLLQQDYLPQDRLARGWLVKDTHGKVVKSPSYSPPNLKQFFDNLTEENVYWTSQDMDKNRISKQYGVYSKNGLKISYVGDRHSYDRWLVTDDNETIIKPPLK